jgi:hypothetical protein
MDDLEDIEQLAGALLKSMAPSARRQLLRRIARDVQTSQAARIGTQRDPNGQPYAPRRERRAQKPGAFAVRFLYPKGASEPRLVFMKSWVRQGPLMTGFDIEAGAIRSFFFDQVAKWLSVDPSEQNPGAGKLRRRGTIRQRAMFRRLRSRANLKMDATDREAWIGFSGRAAEIANVHQRGGRDRPSKQGKLVQYAQRGLLGLTQAERSRMLDMLFEHVVP